MNIFCPWKLNILILGKLPNYQLLPRNVFCPKQNIGGGNPDKVFVPNKTLLLSIQTMTRLCALFSSAWLGEKIKMKQKINVDCFDVGRTHHYRDANPFSIRLESQSSDMPLPSRFYLFWVFWVFFKFSEFSVHKLPVHICRPLLAIALATAFTDWVICPFLLLYFLNWW